MHYKHVLPIAAIFCSFALCFAQGQTAKTPAKTGTHAGQTPAVKPAQDSTKSAVPVNVVADTMKTVKVADSTKTVQTKTVLPADTTKAPVAADKGKSAAPQKTKSSVKKGTETGTAKTAVPTDSTKLVK